MIELVLRKITLALPLTITKASYSGEVLSLVGQDWNLHTLSAWRIAKSGRVLVGCYDKNNREALEALSNKQVVRVFAQSDRVPVDPVFELSTGVFIEIFSTDTFEPWVLKLPGGPIFAASPSIPNAFAD